MALPNSVPWFVLPRSVATWTGPTLLNCWALLLQASNAVAFKSAATTNSWHHFRWLAQPMWCAMGASCQVLPVTTMQFVRLLWSTQLRVEKTCCAREENAQCLDSTDVWGYDMFVDFLFDVLSNGPSKKSIPWSDSCLVLETWCSCITNITWIMVSCLCWLLIVYSRTVLPWVHSWGIGLWQRSRPAY